MRNTDTKHLYNTYLRISRKKQNKPFKLRSNWDGFEETEAYLPLLKLKSFFDRNEIVNIEDFFCAPYEVYQEAAFYDLNFYNTMSAIKVYNIYINKKNSLEPDHDIQIESILRGIKFIKNFCIERKMPLQDYLNYKESSAVINSFIVHLKEKNISIYNLFAFKEFDKVFSKVDYKTLKFIFNDFLSKISIYRSKFYGSKKGKSISLQGLKIIDKEINKNLLEFLQ
jgi:hypothetical protein